MVRVRMCSGFEKRRMICLGLFSLNSTSGETGPMAIWASTPS